MANIKFNNLQEIKRYLNNKTQVALKNTLERMKDQLKEFVKEDVYDAYSPKFYDRTEWLLQNGVIDYYIGSGLNGSYGGVRINTNKNYPVELEKFRHGNLYTGKFYPENFIDMLNGRIADAVWNPFHFPVLDRVSFLDEFEEWANKNYVRIFKEECEKLGINLDGSTKSTTNNTQKYQSKTPFFDPLGRNTRSNAYSSTSVSGAWNEINSLNDIFGIY